MIILVRKLNYSARRKGIITVRRKIPFGLTNSYLKIVSNAHIHPFQGPGSLLRSAGRAEHLTDLKFNEENPLYLNLWQPFGLLMLGLLHGENNRQGLGFLRAQTQQGCAVLKLMKTLCRDERKCPVCCRRKTENFFN